MTTNCGWCASKIVTKEAEKMHGAPLCEDCSNLVMGGQARTPEEIMHEARCAVWIWILLVCLIMSMTLIGSC